MYIVIRTDLSNFKIIIQAPHEVISQLADKIPLQLLASVGDRKSTLKAGEFYCKDKQSCFDLSYLFMNLLKTEHKCQLVTISGASSQTGFELMVFEQNLL